MGFSRGDVICRSEPLAFVVFKSAKGKCCHYCLKSSNEPPTNINDVWNGVKTIPKLKRCSQCQLLYFCDVNCQRKAWTIFHNLECARLKKIPLEDNDLLVARLYMKMKLAGENGRVAIRETVGCYSRSFDDLIGHQEEISEDYLKMFLFHSVRIQKWAKFLSDLYDPNKETDRKLLFDVFCKIQINSSEILDSGFDLIGSGLFLGFSIFDHSCDPDACPSSNGSTLVVRALKDISHDDMRRIRVSYLDHGLPRAQRRDTLQRNYYFTCACHYCLNDEKEADRFKILNNDKAIDSNVVALSETFYELTKNREKLKGDQELKVMLDKCAELLKKQENVLGKYHICRYRLLGVAFDCSFILKLNEEAISVGLTFLEVHKFYYGENRCERGMLLSKMSQLYHRIDNMKCAFEFQSKSYDIMKMFLDEDHPIVLSTKAILDIYNAIRLSSNNK